MRMALAGTHTLPVNGHGHMLVLVSVDFDEQLNIATALTLDDFCHSYLLRDDAGGRHAGEVRGK